MFQVLASYLLDEADLDEADDVLLAAVQPLRPAWSGGGACRHGQGRRELCWEVATFAAADTLRRQLLLVGHGVPGLRVTLNEKANPE